MVKDTALQESAEDFNNDQGHGCCAIFKRLFRKQNTATQNIPPEPLALPAALPTNKDERIAPDVNPAPGNETKPQVNTILEDGPVSKDEDPSQTSREEKANAKFRKAREELQDIISKSDAVSPIDLSFLDSSDIGNLSQMARDIDLAILEFRKGRDKQNESYSKGKATAKSLVHKVSFAGQHILSTAASVASVGSIVSTA